MLYHVKMDVRPPHGIDPAEFDRLKAEEKDRAQALQREGKWVHLWRIAGQYANISVFDVARATTSCTPSSPPCRYSPSWGSALPRSRGTPRRSLKRPAPAGVSASGFVRMVGGEARRSVAPGRPAVHRLALPGCP